MKKLIPILLLFNICHGQAILNRSVIEVYDTLYISGIYQAAGKIINVHPGGYIKGSGIINNAVFDFTDYRQRILDTSIVLNSCRTASKMWSVMLYGAKADGIQDDQPFLQKTSDMMIANTAMTRMLLIPYGNYKINSPWMLYSFVGGQYGQWNLNIIGEEETQGANNSSNPRILPTINCDFAIGVQRAAGGYIKGLSIEGTFVCALQQQQFYATTFSALSNLSQKQFAPNAGVVIDPFCGEIKPFDGGYTNMQSWYRGPMVRSGTTDFHIYQCRVQGFTVDIMNTPNGYTQQGEDCTFENLNLNLANVAIAFGNTQTDNTAIRGIRAWYNVFTVFDNVTYGNPGVGGTIGSIDHVNVAGVVKRIFNIHIAEKDLFIKNIYAEGFYEIGMLESVHATVKLQGSHFNFSAYPQRPQYNATFGNIHISGCTFKYYDDQYNKRMLFNNCFQTTFENVTFDQAPYIVNQYAQYNQADFINCQAFDPMVAHAMSIGTHNASYKLSNATTVPCLYGHFIIQDYSGLNSSDQSDNDNMVAPASTVTYEYNSATFNRFVRRVAADSIKPDRNRQAKIHCPQLNLVKENDYLIDNATGFVIGRIIKVDSLITVSEIPDNIQNNFYNLDLVYYLTIARPFIGDIERGSPIVNNFVPILNAPYCSVGDRIEHPAFPLGTYIVSYNNVNKSVVLSAAASFSADRQNFANGNPIVKIKSLKAPNQIFRYVFGFLAGTEWTQINTGTYGKWIFEKGGSLTNTTYFNNKADYNYEQ